MKIDCYVIHLERAADRRANIGQLMSNSPVQPQILNAVDGDQISEQVLSSVYSRRLYKPLYPFSLVRGEIGAFLSHRTCWKRIHNGDAGAALVLEDDAVLDLTLFQFAFSIACNRVSELGYIQFAAKLPRGMSETLESKKFDADTNVNLSAFRTVPLGAHAQLISRTAASRLYYATKSLDRPVDTFLQMHWLTGQHVATVFPSGVSHGNSELIPNSTIHRRSKGKQKWWRREWSRFLYRSAIRRRSSNHLDARQALRHWPED